MTQRRKVYLFVSCCGGAKATINLPIVKEDTPKEFVPVEIKISGLVGGHSGSDINLQRANANKLMGRVLRQIAKTFYYRIECINGGLMDNAITRECTAVIYLPVEDMEELEDLCLQFEEIFNKEFVVSEKAIRVSAVRKADSSDKVMTVETANKLIYALNLIPYGVIDMSLEIEGLVETSNNLGIVKTKEDVVEMASAVEARLPQRNTMCLNSSRWFPSLSAVRLL